MSKPLGFSGSTVQVKPPASPKSRFPAGTFEGLMSNAPKPKDDAPTKSEADATPTHQTKPSDE